MNSKKVYWNGKHVEITSAPTITKKRKIVKVKQNIRRKVKSSPFSQDYKIGQSVGDLATSLWKLQNNPQPVYIKGHRVHHGAVGLVMILGGVLLESNAIIGFGEALARDDIDDAPDWFKFEKEPSYNIGYA